MSVNRPLSASLVLASACAVMTLSACQPGIALATSAAASSAPATQSANSAPSSAEAVAAVARTSDAAVATGMGGPGSLTLTVTSPRTASGHVDTAVACIIGRIYHANAGTVVDGYTARLSITAAGYHGAGTYPATVTGSVIDSSGEQFAVAGMHRTATLDGAGGTTSFSGTDARGRTVAGTVTWQCS